MSEPEIPPLLLKPLIALVRWLKDEQVPYALVGGIAVAFLGQARATQDIDAVIWLDPERWSGFLGRGKVAGFVPRISDALIFARRSRVLLLTHEPSGISVDLSCGALLFEQELIERARVTQVADMTLRLPTPEDLFIMKLVALRSKDILDLEGLLMVQEQIDYERVRYWTKEFAAILDRPEMMETLERLLHQEQQRAKPALQKQQHHARRKKNARDVKSRKLDD